MDESMACSWFGNDKASQQQELDSWQGLEPEETHGVQLLPISLPAEDSFVDVLQMVVSGVLPFAALLLLLCSSADFRAKLVSWLCSHKQIRHSHWTAAWSSVAADFGQS